MELFEGLFPDEIVLFLLVGLVCVYLLEPVFTGFKYFGEVLLLGLNFFFEVFPLGVYPQVGAISDLVADLVQLEDAIFNF